MATEYYIAREEEFAEMVEMWGATLTANGQTCPCINTPITLSYEMTENAYLRDADTQVDLTRDNAKALQIYNFKQANPTTKRPTAILTIDGTPQKLAVIQCEDNDAAEPTVRLICKALSAP